MAEKRRSVCGKNTYGAPFYPKAIFLITDRKNHIYNRRNVVKWRKRKSAENGKQRIWRRRKQICILVYRCMGYPKNGNRIPKDF